MSETPTRIQRRRHKGWRMPPGAVYVGLPTQWGNPFIVGDVVLGDYPLDRRTAVDLFEAMLSDPDFRRGCGYPADLSPLRGKTLVCWCPLDQPCHADVLLRIANGPACEEVA